MPVVENKTTPKVKFNFKLSLCSIKLFDNYVSSLQIYFFEVVKQCNAIVHLFEKHFQEYVLPCVRYGSVIIIIWKICCIENPFKNIPIWKNVLTKIYLTEYFFQRNISL